MQDTVIVGREVSLTQGKVAIVDEQDFARISQFKWFAHKPNGTTFYAARTLGNGARLYMHRFILNVTDPTILVDHEDRNGLNNRRNNLRKTGRKGNGCNKVAKKTNLYSPYKGVSFRHDTQKFVAHIHLDGVQKTLGCFLTADEAARAYNAAAMEHFGAFALLNEVPNA